VELKSGLCCAKKKPPGKKQRVGSLLTYDTALQVVAGTAQQDLFLNLGLLGRHFIGFLLLAGVEATEKRWKVGR
jgi:hypothetical protein